MWILIKFPIKWCIDKNGALYCYAILQLSRISSNYESHIILFDRRDISSWMETFKVFSMFVGILLLPDWVKSSIIWCCVFYIVYYLFMMKQAIEIDRTLVSPTYALLMRCKYLTRRLESTQGMYASCIFILQEKTIGVNELQTPKLVS